MKLINKHNFIPTVCTVFTAVSLLKIISETVSVKGIGIDNMNYILIFVISIAATFTLSLHYYLQRLPIWIVIVGQYLVLIAFIMAGLYIAGHFVKLNPDGYKDMFRSVTIPYIIGAFVYYLSFLYEVKKANKTLKFLKTNDEKSRR